MWPGSVAIAAENEPAPRRAEGEEYPAAMRAVGFAWDQVLSWLKSTGHFPG